MLIDSQIESYLIPPGIWNDGAASLPLVPPLRLPARDALAIERRSSKGTNLPNEKHRYVLCCERMQDIVRELAQKTSVLLPPLVLPPLAQSDGKMPSARAYLAFAPLLLSWMNRFLFGQQSDAYPRMPAMFFPPEDAEKHFQVYHIICNHPELHRLFERAATEASFKDSPFMLTADQCQQAFLMRLQVVQAVAFQHCGLIDVLELV